MLLYTSIIENKANAETAITCYFWEYFKLDSSLNKLQTRCTWNQLSVAKLSMEVLTWILSEKLPNICSSLKKKNPVNLLEFRTISILMLNIRGKQGNFGATGAYTSTLHCSTYSLLYLSICMLPKRLNECPYGDRWIHEDFLDFTPQDIL